MVAVLLEELTDPTIRNSKLETPLDLAALYGRLRVVKMIINAYPNLMSCNTRKHTPLHLAARNGHKAVVQVLLEAGMDVSCHVSIQFLKLLFKQNFVLFHLDKEMTLFFIMFHCYKYKVQPTLCNWSGSILDCQKHIIPVFSVSLAYFK